MLICDLSRRYTWRFYPPVAANLIACEHRERISPLIDADTLGDFFADRGDLALQFHFQTTTWSLCGKIARPDWLTLVAIRSDERKKSRERAHMANAGEFNRRYLIFQISAILYANRGDRRIKLPGVSPALVYLIQSY